MSEFEVFKDLVGRYRFRLKDENGKVLLHGYGHSRKDRVLQDIESVRRNVKESGRFERNSNGRGHSFILKRTNGDAIARGEEFQDTTLRDEAVDSIKGSVRNAKAPDVA